MGKSLHGRESPSESSRRNPSGFPGYYFYAALFKVPIAKQVIFFIALLGFLFQRGQRAAILRRDELILLVPILVYWVYFNFFFNAQIGVRHVLPVFAVATVFCGRLADPASKLLQLTALILTVWVGVSTLSYYPHFLSYFNELVPDRKLAYRYLADSNLDRAATGGSGRIHPLPFRAHSRA